MTTHHPARELEIIQQFESTQMKAGETWYLIDLPWLQSWLAYAFENRDENGLAQRPGPVTNHTLVDVTTGTFRSELEITRDFRVINANTWNFYVSKYGGGPAISVTAHVDVDNAVGWFAKLPPGNISVVREESHPSSLTVASQRQAVEQGNASSSTGAGANAPAPAAGEWHLDNITESPNVGIGLKPHVHTKYCDRKERVCTAAGKVREIEWLRVETLPKSRVSLAHCYWERSRPSTGSTSGANFTFIEGTEGRLLYQMVAIDAGCLLRFRCALTGCDGESLEIRHTAPMGPVEPSLPKMWDLRVEAEDQDLGGVLRCGSFAVVRGMYTGGQQGSTEFSWLRVRVDGTRERLTQPRAVPEEVLSGAAGGVDDPRRLLLTPDDVGCTLKAKCRPMRADGTKGELATSKPSSVVAAQ